MKKQNIFILSLAIAFIGSSAFAYDLEDGVWKNLTGKYEQTKDNKSKVSGSLLNMAYQNSVYESDHKNNEYNDAYLKGIYGVNFNFGSGITLKTIGKFEPVNRFTDSQTGGENRFFKDQGLYLDELVLGYDYKNFSALAGKMTVNFGDAWRVNNGIWVNQIANQYKQSEKLGIGGIARFGDKKKFGEYVFGASFFTKDRKNFDNSIITSRQSADKKDGEASDTRSPESYTLSTDINYDFANNEKLSYHFAYSNLAINKNQNIASTKDQKGYVANMNYYRPFHENFALKTFIEYSKINNFEAQSNQKVNFLTVNLTADIYKDFFITLAKAKRNLINIGNESSNNKIYETSIGYKFDNLHKYLKGLTFAVSYKKTNFDEAENPGISNFIGVLIRHKIEF